MVRKQKQHAKPKRSNCDDPALREIIAWRIAEERKKAYPQKGGLGKCAEEFGISPQQWSQYEGGHRTPRDQNLGRIAGHLKTTAQKLMTPPENWHTIREEWLAERSAKSRKKTTPAVSAEPGIPTGSGHGSHSSKTLELIQKLITVDKLRSEGKISTENLTSTLKSVDVLIDALCREVGN